MVRSRWRTAWAAVVALEACLLAWTADAHSTRPAPLKRLSHVQDSAIRVLPRHLDEASSSTQARRRKRDVLAPHPKTLRHDDSFLLRFSLPDHEDQVVVSLRPTENLIHPAARVRYHSAPDPLTGETLTRTEALPPSSVRAFTGHVLHHHSVDSWWKEEHASVYRSEWDVDRDPRVRGWARVMVLATEGMEYEEDSEELSWTGAMEIDGMLWHVRTADAYAAVRGGMDPELDSWASHPHRGLVAWREADVGSADLASPACAHDSLPGPPKTVPFRPHAPSDLDLLPPLNPFSHSRFDKRQVTGGDIGGSANVSTNFINSIGSTASCPKSAKVVFVGAAADCTYVQKYGTADAARTQILSNFNSASALYQKSFNVSLGVVELEVMAETCPSTVNSSVPWNVGCPEGGGPGANVDLNTRLSLFSQWRGDKGGGDGAGLWHLMTNCSSGSEVGVAWLSQVCNVAATPISGGQVSSSTGVTAATMSEWQVTAHEIGHNFGAIHDCSSGCSLSSPCCPLTTSTCNANANYIMSPVSTHNTSSFSACSVGNICTTIGSSLNTSCLADPGQRTVVSLQQCGNGIVEPGEDCDPGQNANSTCCTSSCKFRSGAVCDPTNSPCCTSTCGFASSSTVCRPAVDAECDTAEVCTGSNATCPADVTRPDGTSCGGSKSGLSCASGLCTSRDLQCRTQGDAMGITSACPSSSTSSCQISCADPSSTADCILLSSNFIDGTECGYGGRCNSGVCDEGSWTNIASAWYRQHLAIAIPVTILVAVVVILLLLAIFRCVRRRYVPSKKVAPSSKVGPGGRRMGRPAYLARLVGRNPTAGASGEPIVGGPGQQHQPVGNGGFGHPQAMPTAGAPPDMRPQDGWQLPPRPPGALARDYEVRSARTADWVDASAYNGPYR